MRRPDDLVALLKQEDRSVMLDNIKTELLQRKEEIDKNEDKDTGKKYSCRPYNPLPKHCCRYFNLEFPEVVLDATQCHY